MLIMILISDGPTCGTLAAAMTTTNIKLRRRLRLTRGRLVGRMSQERQKLSFFLVLMFLVIFGLIVLAEVLFMEDHKSDIFYEDNTDESYETPKPLTAVHEDGIIFEPPNDKLQGMH